MLAASGLLMLERVIRMFDGVHTPGPDPRLVLLSQAWLGCVLLIALAISIRERRLKAD